MNTPLQTTGIIGKSRLLSVQNLYNSYAAMLLGYIFEAVNNNTVAEQYLIAVFNDVPGHLDEFTKPGVNVFCKLQLMARKKLLNHFAAIDNCEPESPGKSVPAKGNNKYTTQMNAEQKLVFCGIHLHGKTIDKLAADLDKPEDEIRRILKQCFTIIRNNK